LQWNGCMHFAAAKKSLLARRVRFSARRPN